MTDHVHTLVETGAFPVPQPENTVDRRLTVESDRLRAPYCRRGESHVLVTDATPAWKRAETIPGGCDRISCTDTAPEDGKVARFRLRRG